MFLVVENNHLREKYYWNDFSIVENDLFLFARITGAVAMSLGLACVPFTWGIISLVGSFVSVMI